MQESVSERVNMVRSGYAFLSKWGNFLELDAEHMGVVYAVLETIRARGKKRQRSL